MDKFPDVLCGWSWEENKLFELALAVVDERHPDRWEVVAAMVGGKKTAEDVHKHYVILLEDLQFIESGKLDHELAERKPCIQVDCTQSVCWTDDDNNLLVRLDIIDSPKSCTASL
ncbi:protein RADIALIS-like 3 isoform X2 [Hibiscus syriacus]|uniref:protein RADIALIS-like 3 isoform X2 n=1 Tax=Hibiscus syriacus TaxID=106335 RepID=UPI001924B0C9|nr:protein RADIALIS-like 3 isoform X2 [Hibiscus syriacus]